MCDAPSSRRWAPARPGSPRASRRRTAASTASRCRAGSPTAPSSTPSSDALGSTGKGVVAVAPGEQCDLADMYELQPRIGVPFTYAALLASPAGRHQEVVELNRRGWARRRAGVAAGHAASAQFSSRMASPFTLNISPRSASSWARPREARGRVRRPRVARRGCRELGARQPLRPALGDLEIAEQPRTPSSRAGGGRARQRARRRTRSTRCSTSRSTRPRHRASGCSSPTTTTTTVARAARSTSTARWGCPTPART